MNKTLFFLFFLILSLYSVQAQNKSFRSDYKNEIFISAHITGNRTNIYGMGYEYTVLKKKRDYFSIQNEFTKSILPKVGTDRARLQTLFKWNRERMSIVSLGLGTSIRLNSSYPKFSLLLNNGYKYYFRKLKATFSGNILLFITHLQPTPIPTPSHSVCVSNCPKWGNEWRFSASVGKYF